MALLPACSTVRYSALEQVGVHKRDILVDRVESARDAQQETREEVVSAYEELNKLLNVDGGELERRYTALKESVERSEDTIEDLDDRLTAIDRVSKDLFKEWESELGEYTSDSLRRDQRDKLNLARQRYAAMRSRMQEARDRVDPVMVILNDNVLFLKHSLNAQALAALKQQEYELKSEIEDLVRNMQSAIDEANRFIAGMTGQSG